VNPIDAMIAQLRVVIDELGDMRKAQQTRVLFGSPVTGKIIGVRGNVYGGDWFDATGFCRLYNSNGVAGYHTGNDLNRPDYLDSGSNVFAPADGVVRFAGTVKAWQGDVVVLEHVLEDGSHIWTRLAHIKRDESIVAGNAIMRGGLIGVIADYNHDGPKGDHLHFDVCRIDLGAKPGDWPGQDKGRVISNYIDPAAWLLERSK
jgi:murein DD-endopeptidase MepM/ murein hydrolase activator NlpD